MTAGIADEITSWNRTTRPHGNRDLRPNTVELAITHQHEGNCVSSFPRSAWECLPGRSASRPFPGRNAGQDDAERRRRHSHAERGNEIQGPLFS